MPVSRCCCEVHRQRGWLIAKVGCRAYALATAIQTNDKYWTRSRTSAGSCVLLALLQIERILKGGMGVYCNVTICDKHRRGISITSRAIPRGPCIKFRQDLYTLGCSCSILGPKQDKIEVFLYSILGEHVQTITMKQ